MLIFYDFEVYKRLWSVTLIIPSEDIVLQIYNDRDEFLAFYEEHKDCIWCGWNNKNYDQYLVKGLVLDFNLKDINDFIIIGKNKGYQYSPIFKDVKLINYDVMFDLNSLKKMEAFMGNSIKETQIPFDYEGEFTQEMINEVLKYNLHDVEQTIEVFLERKNEFDSQMALIKEFCLPINCLEKTQAQLAAIILGAKRQEYSDEWNIRLPEGLELNRYKYVSDWFMNPDNHNYENSITTKVCGVVHSFGWGGGHGALDNIDYRCKADEIMIMADIDQMYPHLMTKHGLISRSVTKPDKFEFILSESLRLKALKKKKEREPYKRICNITYGAMGDKFNNMYDPLHRNLVCIFGQLLMLMLLEMLEDGVKSFRLVQNNTDGILFVINKKEFDLVDDIIYEWECKSKFHMSFDYYQRIIQKDVNNYIAVDNVGHMKCKGAYVKDLSRLDYDLPIVNRAVREYLVKGEEPEKTINYCNELIEFQQIVRLQGNYIRALHGNEILTEKTFRVFASKDNLDGGIFKQKEGKNKEKFANTSEHVFIVNDAVTELKCPDKLDRNYYINMAWKRIKQFKGEGID